jgi:ATP-dependent Clp protease ATP-binding subunit ClpC
MALAKDEAHRLNHEHLGTEHVLLGLIAEGNGVAAQILKSLDVDLTTARSQVGQFAPRDNAAKRKSELCETPRFKELIKHSLEEARLLDHNYVGTEHLLLGLLRDREGVAALALVNLGLKLQEVRNEVLNLWGHGSGL